MKQKTKQKFLTFGSFAALMAGMLIIAVPAQRYLGTFGLVASELMVLLLALLFAKIGGDGFKETFSLNMDFTLVQFFGALLIYSGTYSLVMAEANVQAVLFPQTVDTSKAISDVISRGTVAVSLAVFAVVPAICEELFVRGHLLHSMKWLKTDWAKSVWIGVFFGIMHFDLLRFFPTAMLGLAFAYVVLKTRVIVLTMFFHFVNNSISIISSYFDSANADYNANATVNNKFLSAIALLIFVGVLLFVIGRKILLKSLQKSVD